MHLSYKPHNLKSAFAEVRPSDMRDSLDKSQSATFFKVNGPAPNLPVDSFKYESSNRVTAGSTLAAISSVFLLPVGTGSSEAHIFPHPNMFKSPVLNQDAVTVTRSAESHSNPSGNPEHKHFQSNGVAKSKSPAKMQSNGDSELSKSPTRVFIKVDFVKISDIDTKSQKFIAEISVRERWTHPSVANMTPLDFAQLEAQQRWDPKLYISNLEDKKSDEVVWSLDVSSGVPTVYLFRRLKGTFFENMELMDFPNDVQDISVTFISEKPSSEVLLCPDEELGIIDVETFQDSQEWHLFQHVKQTTSLKHNVMLSRQSQIMQSTLTASARVSRKMKFFFYNAYLVMFFITGLSFTGFCIAPVDVKFRIGGTLTLLLTSVAFKIAVSNTLPTISYLTKLDVYVLMGVSYLSSKTALFAFISIWKDDADTAKKIDQWLLISLGILQALWQTLYVAVFYFTTFREKKKTQKEEEIYLRELQQQRDSLNQKVAIL